MSASIEIRLQRQAKTFYENDLVQGTIIISTSSPFKHNGITLTLDGSVQIHMSGKTVGVFEAFYNSTKPISLINQVVEVAKPGQINAPKTEFPFDLVLKGKQNKPLYETYHGVFVNIQYFIRVDLKRTFLSKDMAKQIELNIEYGPQNPLASEKAQIKPVSFEITDESVSKQQNKIDVPKFKLTGHFDSLSCILTSPFLGELILEESQIAVRSIEIQLLRVETCGCAEGYAREATEIQNIQIADGDIQRNVKIPIWMLLPRTFTCPTLTTNNFKIEFEINVVLVFCDDRIVTENLPLQLSRY